MAVSLIPSLFHAVAMTEPSLSLRWTLYAKWTTLSALYSLWWTRNRSTPKLHLLFDQHPMTLGVAALAITLGVLYDPTKTTTTSSSTIWSFCSTWQSLEFMTIHGILSAQHRFFVKRPKGPDKDRHHPELSIDFQMATWGEYQTLVFILVIGFMEWQSSAVVFAEGATTLVPGGHLFYPLVAQSGMLGCLVTVAMISTVFRHFFFLPWKMIVQVIGPLATVEICLRYSNYQPTDAFLAALPLCLQWLLDFFLSTEPTSWSWPRYWGVLYWAMAAMVLAAPTVWIAQRRHHAVVITRKWFHFVAIVLFAPSTQYFPQLMALGYAVALCVLVVLETLRHDAPALNGFYQLVHDPSKDNLSDGIILSHMCLILGCAIPLWLTQAMESSTVTPLLAQWGILCLGVGDAMGAVVGKTYGSIRWGKNQRTMEGSLAMWSSMMIVGLALSNDWLPLLLATTFATLLEAYTMQMDNLVLPLAGAVWLVLCSTQS